MVVEPKLEREKESLKLQIQESYSIQRENNYLKEIKQKTIEIRKLTSKLAFIKDPKNAPTRTDLYEKLIRELISLYTPYDPLGKVVFAYRCQVFVYVLTMLPWLEDNCSLYTLVWSLVREMAQHPAVVGSLAVSGSLLARKTIFEHHVLGAESLSVASLMYLIFGAELPGGIETGKKFGRQLSKVATEQACLIWHTKNPVTCKPAT